MSIVCVVPSIRPKEMEEFRRAWEEQFNKYRVTLVTVWDGDEPTITVSSPVGDGSVLKWEGVHQSWRDVVCRKTDGVRNLGFLYAATLKPTHVLTLDDDVRPSGDTIGDHLAALDRKVSIDWMNTAQHPAPMLRGVPYSTRYANRVMLSHGVWTRVPDFDGETQLRLQKDGNLPHSLPYYNGPVPLGVLFPLCGMNVMVRAEALPDLYFAPMGPDTKVDGLNRFADIFMGVRLKQRFDRRGWACWTGGAYVEHTRASDAVKNEEAERLGRKWLDAMAERHWYEPSRWFDTVDPRINAYLNEWDRRANLFGDLVRSAGAVK